MVILFTLMMSWAGADEARACEQLLNDSRLVGDLLAAARSTLPESTRQHRDRAHLMEVIDNIISVPTGGAVASVNHRYWQDPDDPATKISTDVLVYADARSARRAFVQHRDADPTNAAVYRAIAVAGVALADVIRREFVAAAVFEYAPKAAVVQVFADQRFDEFATLPYLVRVEHGRITAITGSADPHDHARAKMKLALRDDLRRRHPDLFITELKTSLLSFDDLIARVKCLDARGRESVLFFEVTGRGALVAPLSADDSRLAVQP